MRQKKRAGMRAVGASRCPGQRCAGQQLATPSSKGRLEPETEGLPHPRKSRSRPMTGDKAEEPPPPNKHPTTGTLDRADQAGNRPLTLDTCPSVSPKNPGADGV